MRPVAGLLFAVLLGFPGLCAAQSFGPPPAAQPTKPRTGPARLSVDVNLVGVAASQAEDRYFQVSRVQFGELATYRALYPQPATPSFAPLSDVSAAYRFTPVFALGGGFSQITYDDGADLVATVPHPAFFGASGTGLGSTAALSRRERAFNISIILAPVHSRRMEWRLFGGPSYFWYSAEMVSDVLYTQTAGAISQNVITVDGAESRTVDGTTFGLHLGSDFAYYVLPKLALTGGVQMGYGTVSLHEPLSNINQQIRVGNTRVCMGVRFALGR